jgi:SAM-dependent methyltransferase
VNSIDPRAEMWNERYRQEAFAYGETPNLFFKEYIEKLTPESILFPAEGEGRNAVYAAQLGWSVTAFDISIEARNKAMFLAEKKKVALDYQVGDLYSIDYSENQFDAIALIYAHFQPEVKSYYHHKLNNFLKIGGTIIFEAFSKNHIKYVTENPKVGGPRDVEALYSIEEIYQYFPNFRFDILNEEVIELNEGIYHVGKGSVIRFIGKKLNDFSNNLK